MAVLLMVITLVALFIASRAVRLRDVFGARSRSERMSDSVASAPTAS